MSPRSHTGRVALGLSAFLAAWVCVWASEGWGADFNGWGAASPSAWAGVATSAASAPLVRYEVAAHIEAETFTDIAAAEDRLYVTDAAAGLIAYDVSDPEAPRELGRSRVDGEARSLVLDGDIALVGDASGAITLFDVSRASAPRRRSRLVIGRPSIALDGQGGIGLVAADDGPVVFDYTQPRVPRVVGRVEIVPAVAVAFGDGPRWAYVAGDGLSVVDLDDPEHPRVRGALPGGHRPEQSAVAAVGRWVFYSEWNWNDLRLSLVDASDPDTLRSSWWHWLSGIGNQWLRVLNAHADGRLVWLVGGTFYDTRDGHGQLNVLDVSDPSSPVHAQVSLPAPVQQGIVDITTEGGFAYVLTQTGVVILRGAVTPCLDPYEPDNSPEEALGRTQVGLGLANVHRICPPGDVDFLWWGGGIFDHHFDDYIVVGDFAPGMNAVVQLLGRDRRTVIGECVGQSYCGFTRSATAPSGPVRVASSDPTVGGEAFTYSVRSGSSVRGTDTPKPTDTATPTPTPTPPRIFVPRASMP